MQRVELLHPLFVHLPLALLLVATLLLAARATLAATRKSSALLPALNGAWLINLFLGTISAWAAIYTGDLAEDIVNRVICDPTVTQLHEELAFFATYAFSLALGAELALRTRLSRLPERVRGACRILQALLCLGGAALLVRTGHLGASLVYQQAAGVYHPGSECQEFSEN